MSTSVIHKSTTTSHARPSTAKKILGIKWLPFAIGAVISVIAIIVLLLTFSGGSQLDKAVKNYVHISYMHESAYINHLAPASVWGSIASKTNINQDELKNYLADNAVMYQEELCADIGNDINLSFDITEKKRIRGDEFTALLETLKKEYHIPDTTVAKAFRLKVDVTLKGSTKTNTYEGLEMNAVEIDGQYYIDKAFAYALDKAKDAQTLLTDQNKV